MFNLVHLNFIGRLNQLVIRPLAKIKNCRGWLGDSETGDSETGDSETGDYFYLFFRHPTPHTPHPATTEKLFAANPN
ncbi:MULTISPECIES: hypothetical protein [Microcystis]|uniref:hypothetical protein n=1 Tax=Microcystis TaxID=1125 RepID=UPI0002EFF991|nr:MULTISPECIES: hypothetical protein [Microcystis]AVQ74065.1 hypothetical protein B5D77_24715 [Microcystis sp. MC19]